MPETEAAVLPYPTIERRRNPSPELMALVRTIHDAQLALDSKLSNHMTTQKTELAETIASLMAEAFPEGDPSGHRRHHELVIKRAEEQAEFWQKMRLELAKWGLIGFIGWALVQLWNGVLVGPPK